MGVKNLLTHCVVGIQLQPSLSLAQDDTPLCSRTSAFSLKSLLDSGVVVGFGSHFLSSVKLCAVVQGRHDGEIALAYIDAHNAGMTLWDGVWGLNAQTHQQIEAPAAAVIPKFGTADAGPRLKQRYVLGVALIGDMNAASQGEDTDLLAGPEGIIPAQIVGERRGDVLGCSVQPLKVLPGVAQAAGIRILPGFGPERLIGATDLSK